MSYYRVIKDKEYVCEYTDSDDVCEYIRNHTDADILVCWRKRDWMRHSSRTWNAQQFMSIFAEPHLSIDNQ